MALSRSFFESFPMPRIEGMRENAGANKTGHNSDAIQSMASAFNDALCESRPRLFLGAYDESVDIASATFGGGCGILLMGHAGVV